MCINTFFRHPVNFDIGFKIRGIFYFTILFLLFGIITSVQFRRIFNTKVNIFLSAVFIIGIINGYYNNNEIYWIKDEIYKVMLIYSGVLAVLLLPKKSHNKCYSPLIVIIMFYFISIGVLFYNTENITVLSGDRTVSYITLTLSFMFSPLFIFEMVKNKIINQSNIKYYILLSVIIFYEFFVAFMRTNIIIVLIGIVLYINIYPSKNTISVDILKKTVIFVIILFAGYFIIIFLREGYIDRAGSDNYRIYEALYVYNNYISDSMFLGGGVGKTFLTSSNSIESEAHIGIITVLLKLGVVGLASILLVIIRPCIQYILYSNSKEHYIHKKVIFLVPSLMIWFFMLSVTKGTSIDQLFGLGLAIGSYLQFCKSIENNVPICFSANRI